MYYLSITPKLQRLYTSKTIAKYMSWHAENKLAYGNISHPRDAEAWKHFDRSHLNFTKEVRSVRLGLCTNRFLTVRDIRKAIFMLANDHHFI
jgi:hypothetical protein